MRSRSGKKLTDRFISIDRNFPLEKFIPTAFLIFFLSVFVLSIITYHNIERYRRDLDRINHSNEVIKQIEEIKYKIVEMPLIRRGYSITGDKNYLMQFDYLINDLNSEMINLKKLTSENPKHQKIIISVDSLISENFSIINAAILDTVFFDSLSLKFSKRQIDATNNVQNNLSKIKEQANELKESEITILRSRNEEANRTNSTIQLFIIITGVFSFAVIGFFSVRFRHTH
ncbi:MAG: CHASE3 domain-containing protein [Ignavibacteria bacterium]|nr:CHASE3 domain-containing protein [Ignavibacteria bacterium]